MSHLFAYNKGPLPVALELRLDTVVQDIDPECRLESNCAGGNRTVFWVSAPDHYATAEYAERRTSILKAIRDTLVAQVRR